MIDLNRLSIAIPTTGTIKSETVSSLFDATRDLTCAVRLDIMNSCYVHDARNKMVNKAIQANSTHILFIDSDMAFPNDAIQKLLDWNKEIIGGLYHRRVLPKEPAFTIEVDGKLEVPKEYDHTQPFKVTTIATGFLMIKREVFEMIEPPYFWFDFYNGRPLGEDSSFCIKAKKAGIDVWCEPNLDISHIGDYKY